MFWFTALNEPFPEFKERNNHYREMLKVALLSAQRNAPRLKPVHIYNGREEAFHDELRALGAEVIFHRLSFEDAVLAQHDRSELWKDTARGAFLRLDIPSLFPAVEEALYTDVDVMFLKDPTKYRLKTQTLALAPEFDIENFSSVNTGSMLLNCKGTSHLFEEIIAFSLMNLAHIPDYDQGAIQLYLQGKWDRLSPLMNWKPYWGHDADALTVHFHGPKPLDFLNDGTLPNESAEIYKRLHSRSPASYNHYLQLWRDFKLN
jgi:lipopolysaccharide biosynthesis glycosyltransferase